MNYARIRRQVQPDAVGIDPRAAIDAALEPFTVVVDVGERARALAAGFRRGHWQRGGQVGVVKLPRCSHM